MVLVLDQLEMLSLMERATLIEQSLEIYEAAHLKPEFPKCSFSISCSYVQLKKDKTDKYVETRVKNPQLKVRLNSSASVVDISTNL